MKPEDLRSFGEKNIKTIRFTLIIKKHLSKWKEIGWKLVLIENIF